MSVDAFTLLFALLAVAAQVTILGAVVLAVGARFSPTVADVKATVVELVGPQAAGLAAIVALVATAGSLYLSEGAGFVPCTLCWYQRIAMYPLALLLGLAAVRADAGIKPYALAVAAAGGAVSIYHVLLERFPTLETGACDVAAPCSLILVERFGYLTIPTMALSAFGLVIVLMLTLPAPRS